MLEMREKPGMKESSNGCAINGWELDVLKAMVKFVLIIDGRKDRVGMADGGILYHSSHPSSNAILGS